MHTFCRIYDESSGLYCHFESSTSHVTWTVNHQTCLHFFINVITTVTVLCFHFWVCVYVCRWNTCTRSAGSMNLPCYLDCKSGNYQTFLHRNHQTCLHFFINVTSVSVKYFANLIYIIRNFYRVIDITWVYYLDLLVLFVNCMTLYWCYLYDLLYPEFLSSYSYNE